MRTLTTPYRRSHLLGTALVAAMATASLVGCTATTGAQHHTTHTKAGHPTGASATTTNAADETPTPEPTPTPPTPSPDGTYTSSCSYVLGDFTSDTKAGYRFLAEAKLENTGNIGTVLKVTAVWYLSGGDRVKRTKQLRLRPGRTKRTGFTVPVGQDEIDRHQALGYGDNCKVHAAMIDTFGRPR